MTVHGIAWPEALVVSWKHREGQLTGASWKQCYDSSDLLKTEKMERRQGRRRTFLSVLNVELNGEASCWMGAAMEDHGSAASLWAMGR